MDELKRIENLAEAIMKLSDSPAVRGMAEEIILQVGIIIAEGKQAVSEILEGEKEW